MELGPLKVKVMGFNSHPGQSFSLFLLGLWCMVKVDEMQFGFMPGKGTIDAVFILRRLQGEKVVYVLR